MKGSEVVSFATDTFKGGIKKKTAYAKNIASKTFDSSSQSDVDTSEPAKTPTEEIPTSQ